MPEQPIRLLAIDPGTKHLGYADFDGTELVDFGVRSIRQGSLAIILAHVEEILERFVAEKKPLFVAFERNQFSQVTSNYRLMRTIQKIDTVSKAHRVPAIGYSARTIRRIITGNGNARKLDAAKTVAARFGATRPYLRGRTATQERFFGNLFDAIACGMAFIAMNSALRNRSRTRSDNLVPRA